MGSSLLHLFHRYGIVIVLPISQVWDRHCYTYFTGMYQLVFTAISHVWDPDCYTYFTGMDQVNGIPISHIWDQLIVNTYFTGMGLAVSHVWDQLIVTTIS